MAQHKPHSHVTYLSLYVALPILALVANLILPLELFYGVNLIFGSMIALLALLLINKSIALWVGIIAACATWWLWGHPYAALSMSLEIIAVILLYRRGVDIIWADLIYWCCLGAPLVFVCYHWGIGLTQLSAGMIALKQAINGLFNATLATLIFLLVQRYWSQSGQVFFRQLMFGGLSMAVLLSGLVPVMWLNAAQKQLLEHTLAERLEAEVMLVASQANRQLDRSAQLWQVDDRHQVQAVSDFRIEDGLLTKGPLSAQLWQPMDVSSKMKRWQQSWLLYPLNDTGSLRQYVVRPMSSVVEPLSQFRATSFLVLFGLIAIGLALSRWFVYQLTSATDQLVSRSRHLNNDGKATVLPKVENIWLTEFKTLDDTLINVSSALSQYQVLQAEAQHNLEQQVKHRTQEVSETLGFLTALLNAASELAVIATKPDGTISIFNIGAERMLGYRSEQLVDQESPALFHLESEIEQRARELSREHSQIIQGFRTFVHKVDLEGSETRQWSYQHKDGHILQVQLVVTAIKDNDNRVIGYLGIARDITKQLQVDEQLVQAKEQAEQAALAKGSFLASMSHEIRTPMNGVMGMLNLMTREPLSPQQLRHLNLAQSSTNSLLSLINDILDFSKIDAGKLALENLDFDPRACIEDIASNLALRSEEKGIELIVDVSDINVLSVRGDPNRFKQVLFNLAGNAIKFTESGEVTLSGAIEPIDDLRMLFRGRITDSGIGIPAESQAELFDSFTQVDASTTRNYGGTGLGLAIVKRLCQLMRGEITVSSELGKGSCFEFTLMFHASSDSNPPINYSDSRQLLILLADSNKKSAEAITRQLAFWNCDVITDERDAKTPIDLILVDQKLLELDTEHSFSQRLQSHDLTKVPCVLLSRVSSSVDAEKVFGVNVSMKFSKPARTEDLLSALELVSKSHDADSVPLLNTPPSVLSAHASRHTDSRILLVEDNEINQEVALGLLDDLGLTSEVVNNGQKALDRLCNCEQPTFDLILMDCQMPVMDGYEATEKIRQGMAGEAARDIPIIAMTANAMKGDREKCIASGMQDYITKPLDTDVVVATLQHWGTLEKTSPSELTDIPNFDHCDDSVVIWDQARALKRVNGKAQRLTILADMFLQRTPEHLEHLEAALKENDLDTVSFFAHALKGSSGNLSLMRIFDLTAALEMAAKSNNTGLCHQLFAQAGDEFNKAKNVLNDLNV